MQLFHNDEEDEHSACQLEGDNINIAVNSDEVEETLVYEEWKSNKADGIDSDFNIDFNTVAFH